MGTLILAGLPLCKLGLHLLLSGRYGYHVDELYFIACGRHLAFGYVDHPPLVPWVGRLSGELFGYGLTSLRLLPALAGALALLITLLIVRQFGGGPFAQLTAGLAVLVAPVYLRSGSLLCLPAFEVFFWTLGAYLLVRLAKAEDARLWLLVGLGACNPHLAHQALSADRAIGLLLPCNVVLRSTGGAVEVSILDPEVMFSITQKALATLPKEAKDRLQAALAALK